MSKDFLKGFAAGFATSESVRFCVKLIKKSIKDAIDEVDNTEDEKIEVPEYNEPEAIDPEEAKEEPLTETSSVKKKK